MGVPSALRYLRLEALQLGLRPIDHQGIGRQPRQIEVEVGRKDRHAALGRHQAVVLLLQRARLGLRRADDRLQAEQDLAFLGISAELGHPALDIREIGRRILGPRLDREDCIGVLGREVTALRRCSGLQDRRAILRRAHDVERPARLEEAPCVLDAVNLRRIGEDGMLAVHDHGILVPARPELAAHLDVLVRAIVPGVGVRPLRAEVGIEVAVDRGDDVPAGSASRQMVDRRPEPRCVEGMAVAGGEGGAETDVLRHRPHVGQQRDRIVLGRLHGIAQRRLQRGPVRVGDVVEVGEEDHVEAAALAEPGDVLIELGAVPAIAGSIGQWMPPHGQTVIGGPVHQELGEVDLALAFPFHRCVPMWRLFAALLPRLGRTPHSFNMIRDSSSGVLSMG